MKTTSPDDQTSALLNTRKCWICRYHLDVHTIIAYNVGMKRRQKVQYTVRGIPRRLDVMIRRRAQQEGKSLNQIALEALQALVGMGRERIRYHDLDSLAGSWVEDPEFEEAIQAQDQVDLAIWQ